MYIPVHDKQCLTQSLEFSFEILLFIAILGLACFPPRLPGGHKEVESW